jgi:DNA-binding response OmpR family regulator
MSKLRTLLIDDSAEIREFVTGYVLKPQGFEVEIAIDGLDGLRKALNNPPDLILTDFEMPRMNGLELLRELRKHHQDIPVILMTFPWLRADRCGVFPTRGL